MEVGSAYVRIRPRVDETVRVLDVLSRLAREIGDSVGRASDDLRRLALEPTLDPERPTDPSPRGGNE